MSTHDAFLRAILTNPDDDLPRLVYADFLDESGDPDRAAFIRLQIDTAKLPPYTPERTAAEEREQTLLADNRERWAVPLAAPVGWMPHKVQFRRGFVEEVDLRNADNWRPAGLAEFLDSPLVALTRLVVSSNDGDHLRSPEVARDLLAHPRLEYLTALQFDEIGVSLDAMEAIVTRAHLARLHALGFWACNIGAAAWRILASDFELSAVQSLGLTHSAVEDGDVRALAGSPRLANLTGLGLAGNTWLTDAAGDAILTSPHLTQLVRLDLSGCDRITSGCRARLQARFGDAVTLDP